MVAGNNDVSSTGYIQSKLDKTLYYSQSSTSAHFVIYVN